MVDAPSVTPKPRRQPEWNVEVKEKKAYAVTWFNVKVTHIPTGFAFNEDAYPHRERNAVPKKVRVLKRRIRQELKSRAKLAKIKKKYGGTQ